MFFHTDTIAENYLEHLVSLHTRSAYHHRIRSDYHNDPTVLIFIRKLPNARFDLCKSYTAEQRILLQITLLA